MSTTTLPDQPVTDEQDAAVRTFRGRTLEELLPRIREELGPDAIVVRQREGLMGGVGGFFQQRFVEVEARAGAPRIDVYDEEPATPESFAALLAEAEDHADPIVTAAAFAPPVGDSEPVLPKPAPTPAAAPEPGDPAPTSAPRPRAARRKPAARRAPRARKAAARAAPAAALPPAADLLVAELTHRGFATSLADDLVATATAHHLPFAGDLRGATRAAIARRIPQPLPTRAGSALAVAFAGVRGAGATRCAAALATAYAQAGRPVVVLTLDASDGGAELRRLLEPTGVDPQPVTSPAEIRTQLRRAPDDALVVLDTPALQLADAPAITVLAEQLDELPLDETQLVMPATLDSAAASDLHAQLQRLAPTALTLTHADVDPAIGGALELACTTRLPLAFVLKGDGALAPADPAELAERLLP